MALIKIPQGDKPGFYSFINTDFVTHITTTVGPGGGVLTFHLANDGEPVVYKFKATNAANADKKVIELIKNHFGASKSIDDAPFQGLVSKASPPSTH